MHAMHAYTTHIATLYNADNMQVLVRDEVPGRSHSIRSIFGESNFPRFSAP